MNRWIRMILFAVFAIGFLISAPLVVLYTAGYRYQIGSNRVVKAGILSVTSTPRGATITLNGQRDDKRTPAVIDNLFPGDVKIQISKPEYSSWEKTLSIRSNESTFIPNAILFLDGTPTQSVDQIPLAVSVSTNTSRFAYLTNTKGTLELWVRDSAFLQDRSIFKESVHPSSSYTLSWSPDEQYVLLTESTSKKSVTLINVQEETVISLPSRDATDVHFDIGSNHHILYRLNKEWKIFGIDGDISFPKKLIADDLRRRNSRLIAVQSSTDQSVVSYMDDTGVASIIAYLPFGTYRFIEAPSTRISLIETATHHLVILDPDQAEPLRLNEEVRFSEWSPKGDRLLLSNGFDAKIFDINSGQMQTITRFSEPLTAIGWYPIGDEILFSQGTTLSAIELDERDVRNKTVLVNDFIIQSFWITKDGSKLSFFGKKSDGPTTLYERKLQK